MCAPLLPATHLRQAVVCPFSVRIPFHMLSPPHHLPPFHIEFTGLLMNSSNAMSPLHGINSPHPQDYPLRIRQFFIAPMVAALMDQLLSRSKILLR